MGSWVLLPQESAAWKGLRGGFNLVLFLLEQGRPWRPNLFWGFKSGLLAKEEASFPFHHEHF